MWLSSVKEFICYMTTLYYVQAFSLEFEVTHVNEDSVLHVTGGRY